MKTKDKTIKVSNECYKLLHKIKKEKRVPIKYLVEAAIKTIA